MGESIISVSTSHIKFTPLCKCLSPKCKQTSINLSPKFVLTLRCYISSELREPPNEREETRTPMTSFDTNDVSNDVILTNHTQDTMMTFLARRNIFCGHGVQGGSGRRSPPVYKCTAPQRGSGGLPPVL